ncbi:MAG: 2-phospho-L-lactate guanylyltransferase [Dehalococcoidia bacterium]
MRAALIPMKELSQAKMRLADVLDGRERAKLALAMLTDVISACNESGRFDVIAVVSADSEVLRHARALGAMPIAEPPARRAGSGLQALNDGLTFGQRYLARRAGAAELVILPADIPLARADDVRTVVDALDAAPGPRAVIVRSRDNGTNALALRPPEAIAMRFGPDSADAHRAAALEVGIAVVVLEIARLSFDVDAPEDLDALPRLPAGAATRGWLDARPYGPSGAHERPTGTHRTGER